MSRYNLSTKYYYLPFNPKYVNLMLPKPIKICHVYSLAVYLLKKRGMTLLTGRARARTSIFPVICPLMHQALNQS